ncbi:MAG: DUF4266 domain-containing protein [Calditrichaeota bacterium]|nr:DUF4266 domain-containing protein [Calditrichota bacterium]MCB9369636.1 DUF4266 domain-containing protein [Calditrichota bacterium]
MKQRLILLAAGAGILLLASGCAVQSVEPWQRDLLAEENMQLVPDPIQGALDEHIYFSKEASSGGQGVGGGGCGCN